MVRDVRKNYPGLTVETLKSGKKRARVRFEGHPNRKIRLNIRMDQPKFSEHYWNARVGIALEYEPETTAVRQSIQWLTDKCLLHLERMVEADQAAAPGQEAQVRERPRRRGRGRDRRAARRQGRGDRAAVQRVLRAGPHLQPPEDRRQAQARAREEDGEGAA